MAAARRRGKCGRCDKMKQKRNGKRRGQFWGTLGNVLIKVGQKVPTVYVAKALVPVAKRLGVQAGKKLMKKVVLEGTKKATEKITEAHRRKHRLKQN